MPTVLDYIPGLGHRGSRRRTEAAEITEAARPRVAISPSQTTVSRAGYAYGIPPGGMDDIQSGIGESTQSDRKSLMEELYQAYLTCPWAWAAVQAIARTVTAGGLQSEWTGDDGEGDRDVPPKPPELLALEALLAYVNPSQNIRQLMRNFIADLLVFADAYIEVVWIGSAPVALYNQDSPTTTPLSDEHGNVSGYVQVDDYGRRVEFGMREIIHVSLDAARPSVLGTAPMQAALGPVTDWLFAAATGKESFQKGLPPSIHADFPAGSQETGRRTWRDQYLTRNIGAKNIGAPIITKGGAKLTELQTGKISDVIAGKNQARDEILSVFGVPPAKAGVIESGNLGGGTGDAQDKTYHIDTCDPIAELAAEALTFHLALKAYGIKDWVLKFGEVDYRDSQAIEDIRDQRLRNGAWTLNRYRAEIGEPPVQGGDDAVLVDRQNLVLWSQLKDYSAANIAAKGAPAVTAGEQPPNGEPLAGDPAAPPDDDPDDTPPAKGGKQEPKDAAAAKAAQQESLTRQQNALYRRRVEEVLRQVAAITETADANASAVYAELSKRFPAAAIGWVKDAVWEGPVNVGDSQIDMASSAEWAASHDGTAERYRVKLRQKIAAGTEPKPVILVRTPKAAKDVVVDGHHRVLAAVAEGRPVRAWIGRVDADKGDWDEMHADQDGGNR